MIHPLQLSGSGEGDEEHCGLYLQRFSYWPLPWLPPVILVLRVFILLTLKTKKASNVGESDEFSKGQSSGDQVHHIHLLYMIETQSQNLWCSIRIHQILNKNWWTVIRWSARWERRKTSWLSLKLLIIAIQHLDPHPRDCWSQKLRLPYNYHLQLHLIHLSSQYPQISVRLNLRIDTI